MLHLLSSVATAIGLFAGTNIEDVVVLAALFGAHAVTGRPLRWQIIAGQCTGYYLLVVASVIAAEGLLAIPQRWVGLLGLIPLTMALWGLWPGGKRHPVRAVMGTEGMAGVAGLALANGGDNLSVYIPYFRTVGATSTLVTLATFALLAPLSCLLGAWVGSHPLVTARLDRLGHLLVPGVYIIVGVSVLLTSRLFRGA